MSYAHAEHGDRQQRSHVAGQGREDAGAEERGEEGREHNEQENADHDADGGALFVQALPLSASRVLACLPLIVMSLPHKQWRNDLVYV